MKEIHTKTRGARTFTEGRYYAERQEDGTYRQKFRVTSSSSTPDKIELDRYVYHDHSGDFKTATLHEYLVREKNHGDGQVGFYDPNGEYYTFSGTDLSSLPSVLNADFRVPYERATEDLYNKIRSGVNLAVDIAEAHQTVRMFKAVTRLTNLIRSIHPKRWLSPASATNWVKHLSRGARSLPKKIGKNAGPLWLEYQYGWKPLVSTIYDTASIRANQIARKGGLQIRTRGHNAIDKRVISSFSLGKDFDRLTLSERVQIIVDLEIPNNYMQLLADFTSLNPANIVWELVPFSFVVDWVYDVGSYLQSMETSLLYANTFKKGQISYGSKARSDRQTSYSGKSGRSTVAGSAWSYEEQKYFKRIPLSAFPFPQKPRFKVDLGSARLLSAASLLSLHVRGR